MLTAILVEDEPVIARGLSMLLKAHADIRILSVCENGKQGLSAILQMKPDLVFFDIEMPGMNGLNMLKALQNNNPCLFEDTIFIVLSGYSNFDYVREALRLKVKEYLLKPITIEALDKILDSVREDLAKKMLQKQRKYIEDVLFHHTMDKAFPNPLHGCTCYILNLFHGTLHRTTYQENYSSEAAFWTSYNFPDILRPLEEKYQLILLPLQSFYDNELLLAIITETAAHRFSSVWSLVTDIYNYFGASKNIITSILSRPYANGDNLHNALNELRLEAVSSCVFGFSSCHRVGDSKAKEIMVSESVCRFSGPLSGASDVLSAKAILHSMIQSWRHSRATQLQLSADLHYLFGILSQSASRDIGSFPDAGTLLASVQNYPELEEALTRDVTMLLFPESSRLPQSPAELSAAVKEWLDMNYAEDISFRTLTELFGYNEKYISSVFKTAYGITPVSYLGNLRIENAKVLMTHNPELALRRVASAVGFRDSYYFSKVFKAHEGISPSAYQQKIQGLK
jgi:two-component system response regulator YesN